MKEDGHVLLVSCNSLGSRASETTIGEALCYAIDRPLTGSTDILLYAMANFDFLNFVGPSTTVTQMPDCGLSNCSCEEVTCRPGQWNHPSYFTYSNMVIIRPEQVNIEVNQYKNNLR